MLTLSQPLLCSLLQVHCPLGGSPLCIPRIPSPKPWLGPRGPAGLPEFIKPPPFPVPLGLTLGCCCLTFCCGGLGDACDT